MRGLVSNLRDLFTPLSILLLPFLAGIVMERATPEFVSEIFYIFILLASFVIIFLVRKRRFLSGAACFLILFVLGALFLRFHLGNINNHNMPLMELAQETGHHIMTGQIVSAPVAYDEGTKFMVEALWLHTSSGDREISGRIALKTKGVHYQAFDPGDWVRFKASLMPVRNFKTPGAFDAETWWMIEGVMVKGSVNSPLRITRVSSYRENASGNPFSHFLTWSGYHVEKMRKRVMRAVDENFSDPDVKAVAQAMLTGERAWLSKDLRDAFSLTGTSHLLAISGLHMALIAFFTGGIAYRLMLLSPWLILRINVKKTSIMLGLMGAIFYALLTGLSPSSQRAIIMTVALGSALLLNRPQSAINSLAIAAFIILSINPMELFSVSFQLSFMAVFFLIIFARNLDKKDWERKITFSKVVKGLIFTTLTASLATAPVIAFVFNRLSLITIPVNLLMTPFVSFLVLPGFVIGALILPISEGLASIAWNGTGMIFSPSLAILKSLAKWEWASVVVPSPFPFALVIMYAMLFLCAFFFSNRRLRAAFLLIFLMMFFVPFKNLYSFSHGLKLHVLDVGQGTSQVIELPGRKVVLMDGGGFIDEDYNMGNMVIGPFLRRLGYTRIDMVIASHPEADHIGGLPGILRDFKVEELITNEDAPRTLVWKRLMQERAMKGIRHSIITEKKVVTLGGATIEIFPHTGCKDAADLNSRSLVILVRYQGVNILLTGDIDKNRERCLVSQLRDEVDVLVVPHHGSRSSSGMEFIKNLSPEISIIPVGWRNKFGLPDKEVIKRYEEQKARVIRTDIDGTVTVHVREGQLTYETFIK